MRILRKLLLPICLVLATTTANATEHNSGGHGEHGAWSFEIGQGMRSSMTEAGNASLGVNCVQTAANVLNSLDLFLGPNSVSEEFEWQIDNGPRIVVNMKDGQFSADTPWKQSIFEQITTDLKSGEEVWIWLEDEPVARFSLSGSSKAIGDCAIKAFVVTNNSTETIVTETAKTPIVEDNSVVADDEPAQNENPNIRVLSLPRSYLETRPGRVVLKATFSDHLSDQLSIALYVAEKPNKNSKRVARLGINIENCPRDQLDIAPIILKASGVEIDLFVGDGHPKRCDIDSSIEATELFKVLKNAPYIDIRVNIPGYGDDFQGWYRINDVEVQSKAEEVQAPEPAVEKIVEPAAYNIANLPSSLTSVELIPSSPAIEVERKRDIGFLANNQLSNIDGICLDAAYPYLRAKQYWETMDRLLDTANYRSNRPLTRDSAKTLCANQAAKATKAAELVGYSTRAFLSICTQYEEPETYRLTNLTAPDFCNDLASTYARLGSDEYDACMRTGNREDKTEAELTQYCQCSADRVTTFYTQNGLPASSSIMISTAAMARNACDG